MSSDSDLAHEPATASQTSLPIRRYLDDLRARMTDVLPEMPEPAFEPHEPDQPAEPDIPGNPATPGAPGAPTSPWSLGDRSGRLRGPPDGAGASAANPGATTLVLMNISGCRPPRRHRRLCATRPPRPTRARQVNRAIVERFLAARDRRDVDGCLALVAEDATWHSPVGPPQRGRSGFRQAIEGAYARTRWFVSETLGVHDDGHSVVARVRNRGERDGESLDSVQRLVFRLTDGLISDVRIHVDDPPSVSAFWSDDPT